LPPPSSSMSSSVSRSASRSDSSEDLSRQRHSSRSSSYPAAVETGYRSTSASPPGSVVPEEGLSPSSYGASTLSKKLAAKSHLAETTSSDENTSSNDDSPAAIVNYKQPRPIHDDCPPTVLSTYGEPVWQVVQDMREQRMSLCQTLRQYVFVHAAVIEGALMVADEEREASGKGSPICRGSPVSVASSRSGSHFSSTTPSKGKRGASPTELLKKDKKGEVSLAKRPSTKRKQSGIDGRDAIFEMTTTGSFGSTSPVSSRRSLSGNGAVVR
jgi:protein-tyrosine phosphatase